VPLLGNLDEPATLGRLGAWPTRAAPGAAAQPGPTRPAHARPAAALARGGRVQRLVYASTTGVYGDCAGERFDETRAVAPATDRARRRVDAEAQPALVRPPQRRARVGAAHPGHLRRRPRRAATRATGCSAARRRWCRPTMSTPTTSTPTTWRAPAWPPCCAAGPQRVVHVCDDTEMLMGDYFDLAADLCGLPRPPRITRAQAEQQLSPMQLSFMSESRRLDNRA
jgi:hypothetical protein